MTHTDNTLSVSPGNIILNGSRVRCVTAFKYECIESHTAKVTIAFNIPVQKVSITNQPTVAVPKEDVPAEIRIPVLIGGEQVDEIVFEQISHMDGRLSRKELLKLALPTLDRNIKSAASGDINYKCLEQFLLQRKQIKEELKFLTGKED